MTREEMIDILGKYRRPGSPSYRTHFSKLPAELLRTENVSALLGLLRDDGLPTRVRENAAGALGMIGDPRAIDPLIDLARGGPISACAVIALGCMRARDAADVLKERAAKLKAARWAYSELGLTRTVQEAIDDLRGSQLRAVPHKLGWYPLGLRRKVEEEIVRQFGADLDDGGNDLRWYVSALTQFTHPEAGALLARTLECAWEAMGSEVGLKTKKTCCGCLHIRTLRALKMNPSPKAVPALVTAVTNRYQRHAAVALKRLRELDGGGLSDKQIAEMVRKSAGIVSPLGAHALAQVIRFAGDYGGAKCRDVLLGLKSDSGKRTPAVDAALKRIEARL